MQKPHVSARVPCFVSSDLRTSAAEEVRVERLARFLTEEHAEVWKLAGWTRDALGLMLTATEHEIDATRPVSLDHACEHPIDVAWWQSRLAARVFPRSSFFLWLAHVAGVHDIAGLPIAEYRFRAQEIFRALDVRAKCMSGSPTPAFQSPKPVRAYLGEDGNTHAFSEPDGCRVDHLVVYDDLRGFQALAPRVCKVHSRLIVTCETSPDNLLIPLVPSLGLPVEYICASVTGTHYAFVHRALWEIRLFHKGRTPKGVLKNLPQIARYLYDREMWYPFTDEACLGVADESVVILVYPDRVFRLERPVPAFAMLVWAVLDELACGWDCVRPTNPGDLSTILATNP